MANSDFQYLIEESPGSFPPEHTCLVLTHSVKEVAEPLNATYDLTRLKLFSDDDEFVDYMINLFLEEIPKSLHLLGKHVSNQDYQGIKFIAHDMISSVDLIGLNILDDLQEMESLAARESNFKRLKGLSAHVMKICNHALTDLQKAHSAGV